MKQRDYEAGVRLLRQSPSGNFKPKNLKPAALSRLAQENDELRERQARARELRAARGHS